MSAAVRSAATQLARSIDDVLDMAQIDAYEMALDLGDVYIATLLDQRRGAARASPTRTTASRRGDAGAGRADPRRRPPPRPGARPPAWKTPCASPPAGGDVTLAARRAEQRSQVARADTGRGIPFHVQAHIFDRFVGRDRGGPGLSLALVKALVELHGGWVALESEPNEGSTFTCHLPEAAQADAAHPELDLG